MSDPDATPPWRHKQNLLIVGAAAAAAIVGEVIGRGLSPVTTAGTTAAPRRPIIQLVRPQSSLPSLADNIDRICPSVAAIVPHGSDATPVPAPVSKTTSKSRSGSTRAAPPQPLTPPQGVLISADGWIIFAGQVANGGALDALFGDGRRVRSPTCVRIRSPASPLLAPATPATRRRSRSATRASRASATSASRSSRPMAPAAAPSPR